MEDNSELGAQGGVHVQEMVEPALVANDAGGAGALRPLRKVFKVVSTRATPWVRVIQPWSIPMPMAVSPNPTAAMLQAEPVALRSGTRPLAGLAPYQK